MIKNQGKVIARSLLFIFEKSWQLAKVPGDWKKITVTPVFKKDKIGDLGNYNSISLTSFPGKVTKKIIVETISKHIKNRTHVIKNQFPSPGFKVQGNF